MDNYKTKHVKKLWQTVYDRNLKHSNETPESSPSSRVLAEANFAMTPTKRHKCTLIDQRSTDTSGHASSSDSPITSESRLTIESYPQESSSSCSLMSEASNHIPSPSISKAKPIPTPYSYDLIVKYESSDEDKYTRDSNGTPESSPTSQVSAQDDSSDLPTTSESRLSIESYPEESSSSSSLISETSIPIPSPSTQQPIPSTSGIKPKQISCQIHIMEPYLKPDNTGKLPIVRSNTEKALKNVQKELLQADCLTKWGSKDTLDLTVIGPNGTTVSTEFIISLDWTSGSQVTRKLLTHIFDRDTLATHTLTGKPSPAFKDQQRPVKARLDPKKIGDIIHAVTHYANCSAREVRMAITTKCADENKIYRNRLKKNKENFGG